MKVYVGSSLHNANRVREIQARFKQAGVSITYDWTTHGQVYSEDQLAAIGESEERGVEECDLFFMIQPGRTGTHYELGLARGLRKPVVILEEVEVEKKTFYYCLGVHRFKSEDEAFGFALRLLQGMNE